MKHELQIGDWVKVMDRGLLMLQQFAPKGAKPNNEGRISEFNNGYAIIEFPIGNDKMSKHSQAAPYPVNQLVFLSEEAPEYFKSQA